MANPQVAALDTQIQGVQSSVTNISAAATKLNTDMTAAFAALAAKAGPDLTNEINALQTLINNDLANLLTQITGMDTAAQAAAQ